MRALLLIDLQNDFLSSEHLSPKKEILLENVKKILDYARENSWEVIHIRTKIDQDKSDAMPHWKQSGYRCIENSQGVKSPQSIEAIENETIIYKQFYSGFENGELLERLHVSDVKNLFVCGVHTHACVNATVLDAYAKGFKITIINETVGSYDDEHAKLTLNWLDKKAAACIPMSEFFAEETKEKELVEEIAKINRALKNWQTIAIKERKEKLQGVYDALLSKKQEMAELITQEVFKPIKDSYGEVDYGLAHIKNTLDTASDEELFDNGRVKYVPHGIVSIITPWNNPFAIAIAKIIPALVYGNGVIYKPSPYATNVSKKIYEILRDCGFEDLVSLLFGDAQTGRMIVAHSEIKAIAFTGSVRVGEELQRACAKSKKALQAEMGGNNAVIILEDMATQDVAKELVSAMFSYSGQRCTAIRRVIIEASVYDSFSKLICEETAKLIIGDPMDEATQIASVISKTQQEHILKIIETAKEQGADILVGETLHVSDKEMDGHWILPTIIANASLESTIVKEELFAPVAVLLKAQNFDDALCISNSVEYGLLGAIYTKNENHIRRFIQDTNTGIICINQARPKFSYLAPFNGWKASGYGIPEHGRWNRDFYTKVQTLYM